MKKSLKEIWMVPANYRDVFILALFTILITFQPYFMHGKINVFETGLYLPGIQSILDGGVPFRDVFHLRGPFELYMPAFLMKLFGEHITVMFAYFYFGNVLCLILTILVAKEFFKTRAVLYLMAPVLVGRTFPRVVFTYWGGMRYAFGMLAIWFIFKYFQKKKMRWIFGAGIVSAVAGFTSVEMGAYPFLGFLAALVISRGLDVQGAITILKSFGMYLLGMLVIAVPFGTYLYLQGALFPYIDGVLTIVFHMQKVIDPHFVSEYPRNFPEAFVAMTNPGHTNFKHMTPSYLYIFIVIYLFRQFFRKSLSLRDLMIICLGVYGFVMYNTGFRGIWAAQFEMSLQPEKILLFFLLEGFLLYAVERKEILGIKTRVQPSSSWYSWDRWRIYGFNTFIFIFIFSSIGYSIQRYNHRFYAFKYVRNKLMGKDTEELKPLANENTRALKTARARGIIVPADQADEIEDLLNYIKNHADKKDEVLIYPDFGTYNFLADQPFYRNFPLATFTWFNRSWHNHYIGDFRIDGPRYIAFQKEIPEYWKAVYLALEPNRQKFQDMKEMAKLYYRLDAETDSFFIYKRK